MSPPSRGGEATCQVGTGLHLSPVERGLSEVSGGEEGPGLLPVLGRGDTSSSGPGTAGSKKTTLNMPCKKHLEFPSIIPKIDAWQKYSSEKVLYRF